jgi:hypothetical protein
MNADVQRCDFLAFAAVCGLHWCRSTPRGDVTNTASGSA